MSDFLDNLILRSLNQLEVIQPRLASIFEPQPLTPPARPSQDFADEQSDISAVSEQIGPNAPSPRRGRAARTPLHVSTTQPANEEEAGETVSRQEPAPLFKAQPEQLSSRRAKSLRPLPPAGIDDTSSVNQPVVAQPPRPSPAAQLKLQESPPVIKTETKQASVTQVAQPPALLETIAERIGIQNEKPQRRPLVSSPVTRRLLEQPAAPVEYSSPSPLEREAQPSPLVERLEVRQPIIAAAQDIPAARGIAPRQPPLVSMRIEPSPLLPAPRATSHRLVTVQPLVRRQMPPVASRQDEPNGVANETPAIQVTIGRIEVRAALASPPRASGQHPAQPLMSLSDYLHQRSSKGDSR